MLYRCDCVGGMKELIRPAAVDVVVTSPPYNLGIAYGSYDDTAPRSEYLSWIASWGRTVETVLSPNGSLFLNIAGKPSEPWGPFEVLERLRKQFVLQNTIHWIKSIAIDAGAMTTGNGPRRSLSIGHYKPINSKRYVNDCHEYIFHLTKTGDVPLDRRAIGVEYQDKSNISRWNGATSGVRCRGNMATRP
ncbi:MAG: site-specific DNA-methyltransferase [Acidobacteria bacterium]|nr:site-specific DNA-methyltransferase [Acidobacteriota bacterium]